MECAFDLSDSSDPLLALLEPTTMIEVLLGAGGFVPELSVPERTLEDDAAEAASAASVVASDYSALVERTLDSEGRMPLTARRFLPWYQTWTYNAIEPCLPREVATVARISGLRTYEALVSLPAGIELLNDPGRAAGLLESVLIGLLGPKAAGPRLLELAAARFCTPPDRRRFLRSALGQAQPVCLWSMESGPPGDFAFGIVCHEDERFRRALAAVRRRALWGPCAGERAPEQAEGPIVLCPWRVQAQNRSFAAAAGCTFAAIAVYGEYLGIYDMSDPTSPRNIKAVRLNGPVCPVVPVGFRPAFGLGIDEEAGVVLVAAQHPADGSKLRLFAVEYAPVYRISEMADIPSNLTIRVADSIAVAAAAPGTSALPFFVVTVRGPIGQAAVFSVVARTDDKAAAQFALEVTTVASDNFEGFRAFSGARWLGQNIAALESSDRALFVWTETTESKALPRVLHCRETSLPLGMGMRLEPFVGRPANVAATCLRPDGRLECWEMAADRQIRLRPLNRNAQSALEGPGVVRIVADAPQALHTGFCTKSDAFVVVGRGGALLATLRGARPVFWSAPWSGLGPSAGRPVSVHPLGPDSWAVTLGLAEGGVARAVLSKAM